jgi:hypothetical protein
VYREILARAHAAVTNRMPTLPTVAYYKQEQAHLHERILLSMQRLELELRLRDILVADFEVVIAKLAELGVGKGKGVATD